MKLIIFLKKVSDLQESKTRKNYYYRDTKLTSLIFKDNSRYIRKKYKN